MNEQLIKAAKEGDLKLVKELLAKGAQLDCRDKEYNSTPLLWAANGGHLDVVKYLLTEAPTKANITESNKNGSTALLFASHNGHTETVKYLLTEAPTKAKMTETNKYGNTALLLAAFNGHTETVKYLLTEAPTKAKMTETDKNGNTALLCAATYGHTETVKYLLTEAPIKAQLTEASKVGDSCLALAAWKQHLDTVAYLLSQGAYIDMRSNNGNTPREEMVRLQTLKAVPLLQAAEDLITIAEQETKIDLDSVLNVLGPNLNARSRAKGGNTALHFAINKNNLPLIMKLLEKGASLEIPNEQGVTPYQLAMMGDNACVKSLAHTFKAKQLMKGITDKLQQQSTKPQGIKVVFSLEAKQSLDVQNGNNLQDSSDIKDKKEKTETVKTTKPNDSTPKANLESKSSEEIENLKSELERHLNEASECFSQWSEQNKQEFGYYLGELLALPETAPLDAARAYEILSQIDKKNNHFAKANALIYRMILGGHLLITPSLSLSEKDATPIVPKEIIPMETLLANPKAAFEHLPKGTKTATLRALIKHLLYADLKDEPLKNYVATYCLGGNTGICTPELESFTNFQDADSVLQFIDKMRKQNFGLKKEVHGLKQANKQKDEEIERQNEEIYAQRSEMERQRIEIEKQRKINEELAQKLSLLEKSTNTNAGGASSSSASTSASQTVLIQYRQTIQQQISNKDPNALVTEPSGTPMPRISTTGNTSIL